MLPKKPEKKKAIRLREQGRSLNEIARQLKVSKASVSIWVRDTVLSKRAQERIERKKLEARMKAAKTNRERTERLLQNAAANADAAVSSLKLDVELMQVMCALIYWCEGEKAKNDKTLTFANSDPRLVTTFLFLLRKSFELDEGKLRVCLHLHDYHKEKVQVQFWSRVTRIPPTQFLKTYHKQHTGKRTREGYAGCASIRYYDTRIARQLQALARAFLKKTGP
ncbi:MAG: hypothetical protein Q7S50_00410 [bacterium]|nr:hypothetical protein [bacterium]